MVVPNLLNIPKAIWLMVIVIFALLGSIIGVSTHIDTLQFQEIDRLNDKLHELDKQVAINNERILANSERIQGNSEEGNQNYHPGDHSNSNNSVTFLLTRIV